MVRDFPIPTNTTANITVVIIIAIIIAMFYTAMLDGHNKKSKGILSTITIILGILMIGAIYGIR